MAWHEAAREKLRCCQASAQRLYLVARTMFQKIDFMERRAIRGRDAGIAVPGCSMHPDFSIANAKNDAVVAQDVNTRLRCPEPRCGALPCSRMSQEEPAAAIAVNDSNGMHFKSFAAPEPVDHQYFVKRVFQRIAGLFPREEFL